MRETEGLSNIIKEKLRKRKNINSVKLQLESRLSDLIYVNDQHIVGVVYQNFLSLTERVDPIQVK